MDKLGAVVPPLRTIEAILARAGATRRERPQRRLSKGVPYPAPTAERAGDVVQFDLVGPRYLQGGARFLALTQIDVCSHHAGIEIVQDRGDGRVLAALGRLWGRHRGATPVFIPPREPWRNRHHRTLQRHLRAALLPPRALHEPWPAHRPHRRVRARPQRAAPRSRQRPARPDETAPVRRRQPLAIDTIPDGWPDGGRVEFIRCIGSDHKLRLLGRAIQMPDGSAYRYFTATLDLSLPEPHNLLISDEHGELITTTRLARPRT